MTTKFIKRYDTLSEYAVLWAFEDGEYVRYADHVEIVDAFRGEIDMLRELAAGLSLALKAEKGRAK